MFLPVAAAAAVKNNNNNNLLIPSNNPRNNLLIPNNNTSNNLLIPTNNWRLSWLHICAGLGIFKNQLEMLQPSVLLLKVRPAAAAAAAAAKNQCLLLILKTILNHLNWKFDRNPLKLVILTLMFAQSQYQEGYSLVITMTVWHVT